MTSLAAIAIEHDCWDGEDGYTLAIREDAYPSWEAYLSKIIGPWSAKTKDMTWCPGDELANEEMWNRQLVPIHIPTCHKDLIERIAAKHEITISLPTLKTRSSFLSVDWESILKNVEIIRDINED